MRAGAPAALAAIAKDFHDVAQELVAQVGHLAGAEAIRRLWNLTDRIDGFEAEFDISPRELPQWSDIQADARTVLAASDAYVADKSIRSESLVHRWMNPAGDPTLVRAAILSLSGDLTSALSLATSLQPFSDCGSGVAAEKHALRRRVCTTLQAMGDWPGALAAFKSAHDLPWFPMAEDDTRLCARLGPFLHERVGQWTEARSRYLRLIDLHPGTPDAAVATARLQLHGAFEPPSSERLRTYMVDPNYREDAIAALGMHRFADSYEWLLHFMPPVGDGDFRAVCSGLGDLGDRRAITVLQGSIDGKDAVDLRAVLWALLRLGDVTHASRILRNISQQADGLSDSLDAELTRAFGGGPDVSSSTTRGVDDRRTASMWAEWIESRASSTSSPIR